MISKGATIVRPCQGTPPWQGVPHQDWTHEQVFCWLTSQGLDAAAYALKRHNVTGAVLCCLSPELLDSWALTPTQVRRVEQALAGLGVKDCSPAQCHEVAPTAGAGPTSNPSTKLMIRHKPCHPHWPPWDWPQLEPKAAMTPPAATGGRRPGLRCSAAVTGKGRPLAAARLCI